MVKCGRNVNFEELNAESSAGKKDEFWLLREIFKDYIKQNFIPGLLRKAISHSVDICRFIKKSTM